MSERAHLIKAEIVGTVSMLFVDDGAVVEKGQKVLGIECMKQLWDFDAPAAGRVNFKVALGDTVEQGQTLAAIISEEA